MTLVDPEAARAAIGALLLRYNPAQRRDGDGKWTDGPGGGGPADLTRANVDMSPDERQFLSDYVEDGRTYREVNDALRGQREMTPEMAEKVEKLDALTDRAELSGDTTLYRAMSVKQSDPLFRQAVSGNGSTLTDPGFGSVSGDRDAVEDFKGTTEHTIVFEISAAKGQPVLVLGDDLSDTAMMQTAQEALLPRGYKLRIDKSTARRRDGQMVWTVKATYMGVPDRAAITAAFNPNQRRGDDGRWISMGGGLPDLGPDAPERYGREVRQYSRGIHRAAVRNIETNREEGYPDPTLDGLADELQAARDGGDIETIAAAAAAVRSHLLGAGYEQENTLQRVPIFGLRGLLIEGQPKPNPNGLLQAGAAYDERLAALRADTDGPVWARPLLAQGQMGETRRLQFENGTTSVYKRALSDFELKGDNPHTWTMEDQTDAEELAAAVGGALGLRTPAVDRVSPTEISMEFVGAASPGDVLFANGEALPDEILNSPDGVALGLFDVLIDNNDRHGGNYLVDNEDRVYPIDHGLAFTELQGLPRWATPLSPFAAAHFTDPRKELRPNALTAADVQRVRERLEAIRPQFEELGRGDWFERMLDRLDQVGAMAQGTQEQLDGVFAFNPNQRRAPDGRWIKMGGAGSAGGRIRTPRRAVGSGVAYSNRQHALERAVAGGVADSEQLSGGYMGETNRLRANDGTSMVSKRPFGTWGDVTAEAQLDAEELAAAVADVIGISAPAVHRADGTVYMELMPGKPAAARRIGGQWAVPDDMLNGAAGIRMGLLDVLTDNPDRSSGNWMVDDDRGIHAIDHGMAFHSADTAQSRAVRSPFAAEHYIHPDGSWRATSPLTAAESARVRAGLEALRPRFVERGRASWLDQVLDRLDRVGIAGGQQSDAEMAFNPHQRRGDDGKWIRMGGSGPTVRAERATRRGLRPTMSDSVKLPPRPPVKAAPRGSFMGPAWDYIEDPDERASRFWQGRFSDQQAIRQVFRNIAAGKDPVDGLNLETNPNWDLHLLRSEPPRPPGESWEQYEAKYPNGEGSPRVYDREDLRNELINSAVWLHEQLADAPITTQPLYRGMRMKAADVPKEGDTWDSDVISWAEQRWQVERYAWMPEDPELGRVGEMEVVFRLNGPKRSVDLGPGMLDEHLTQGRYKVVKVSGQGRKRFITVEEATE